MLSNLLIWENFFSGCDQIKKNLSVSVLVKELPLTTRKSWLWKYGITAELTYSTSAVKGERERGHAMAEPSVLELERKVSAEKQAKKAAKPGGLALPKSNDTKEK